MHQKVLIYFFALLLAGCAANRPAGSGPGHREPDAVLGKTWQWVETITPVDKIAVATPEHYAILLMADGKLQAQFDCNRGGGAYEISAGKLSFGQLFSTRMACPPGSLDGTYMRDLQRVVSFFVQDGDLYLEFQRDSGTMRFRLAS